jgi:outer membrane protein OmpA-like peptidoglycan-associated protein
MKLRLLTAAALLALLVAQPAFAQDECLDLTPEECAALYGGGGGEVYEEPAYEEPVYEEPAYEEPVYEEPAYEEPVYEEPAYEEPVYEEPVYEEPVYEEPAYEEPVYEEPAYEEPVYEEPAAEEPVYEEPALEEPVYEEPVYDEPALEEPAFEEPVLEEPVYEEDVPVEEPAADDSILEEEPAQEEPAIEPEVPADEPVFEEESSEQDPVTEEETGTDEPALEETPADEPIAEDTAAEDEQGLFEENSGEALIDETAPEELSAADEAFAEPEAAADDPLADAPAEELLEATEPLPEGVSEEFASPLLDSAKTGDFDTADTTGEDVVVPESDEQAQIATELSAEEIVQQASVEGTTLEAAPEIVVPQNVTIINNVENTYIYQVNNTVIINNSYDDRDRLSYGDGSYQFDQIGDNRFRETLYRDDGSVVVTTRDQYGNILERYVTDPYGDSYVLAYFEPDYYDDLVYWRDPGYDLPPLRLTISLREYVLDWRYADADDISVFFRYPPVEPVRRVYSIDEVKRSARLRDSVRRLEITNLNFTSGSAELSRNQADGLERLAAAMKELLRSNPGETFLIEGHTDAKGSTNANLILSDKRASNVARILTQFYGIPPENLATQGYGEQFLKVNTQRAEPQNRRVTVRRITPLITPRFAER